mmetsp:Transcript_11200/g.26701  ORF Transcript_11200/g.26701 Transcript_11200/m.26701 type:complete len:205 (-) Transcript_11200:678-1292(-)
MHTIPRSPSTMAPASRRRSFVSSSRVTAAVRPTPDAPRPVVDTACGDTASMNRNSCDLPQDGSPINKILISPLKWVPLSRFFSAPPKSSSNKPFLTSSCPKIVGAIERDNSSKVPGLLAMFLMASTSAGFSSACLMSSPSCRMQLEMRTVLKTPEAFGWEPTKVRYTPVISTLSPGLTLCTKSSSAITSTYLGKAPEGACSGIS